MYAGESTRCSEENRELPRTKIMSNDNARKIPSPPSGERVRVRGRPGRAPQYGKHSTRTTAARDFARSLRKNATDAEKRLWRLVRDRRFAEFKFRIAGYLSRHAPHPNPLPRWGRGSVSVADANSTKIPDALTSVLLAPLGGED